MADVEPVRDAESVLELISSGRLLNAIQARLSTAPPDPLGPVLVDLHSTGRIQLIDLISGDAYGALDGHRRYVVQSLFAGVLPAMVDGTPAMLEFVTALERGPDQPVDYGGVRTALRKWLEQDLARPAEIVQLAEAGDATAARFVNLALQSMANFVEARRLAASTDTQLQAEALIALAWMRDGDAQSRAATVDVLVALTPAADDTVRARILFALLGLFEKADVEMGEQALVALDALLNEAGAQTRRQAGQGLWRRGTVFDGELVDRLLESQLAVEVNDAEGLHALDLGLYGLAEAGRGGLVIDFLTRLLGRDDAEIPLSAFDMAVPQLVSKPDDRDQALVRWLLADGNQLALGFAEVQPHGREVPFRRAPELSNGTLPPGVRYALCIRAIGHLYFRPVLVASVLTAVLDGADKALAASVEELLFDPLLINYGGDLQTWLEAIPKTDPAYAGVRRALKRKKAYLAGLQKVDAVKELRPPERHRQAEFDKHADEMRRSFAAAQSRMPLLSVIPKSVILYGRRTTSVIRDHDGSRRLSDNRLATHSSVVEVPRSSILDPFGLEEMLLIFRTWRIAA